MPNALIVICFREKYRPSRLRSQSRNPFEFYSRRAKDGGMQRAAQTILLGYLRHDATGRGKKPYPFFIRELLDIVLRTRQRARCTHGKLTSIEA